MEFDTYEVQTVSYQPMSSGSSAFLCVCYYCASLAVANPFRRTARFVHKSPAFRAGDLRSAADRVRRRHGGLGSPMGLVGLGQARATS